MRSDATSPDLFKQQLSGLSRVIPAEQLQFSLKCGSIEGLQKYLKGSKLSVLFWNDQVETLADQRKKIQAKNPGGGASRNAEVSLPRVNVSGMCR